MYLPCQSACLFPDDLEGLNTLYPACTGAVTNVVCAKSTLNTGYLRLCFYISTPPPPSPRPTQSRIHPLYSNSLDNPFLPKSTHSISL